MNRIVLILHCLTAFAKGEAQLFPFISREVTGIPQHIIWNGQEVAIRFSERTDNTALAALNSLDWRVLYASGDGKHIFLRGELAPEIKRTPQGTGLPEPEEYREFTLLDWHITTPFPTHDWVDVKNSLAGTRTIVRPSLKAAGSKPLLSMVYLSPSCASSNRSGGARSERRRRKRL